ncbi:DNA repair protein XRCC1 isoform X1 [Podarcis raffonei]|uniref:DNA repair protein XRCC1 isoform X1 n=1 Tax=Podarcis raffonei TaxID=65483 RepID=UPI00232903FA|nr:DNA repair protein XRCC1 isoform X1 [Podarcis raffonei]
MPEIAIRHVVSASSSDPTHCAENLLKADTYRKWKAAQAGEKHISAILQFEKEEHIHSIDIGNEGSAFVEVLAGSSASSSEQNYEVLLVTSSFMSPSESKSGTNLNRVRMFGPDKLVKATAERKWDRVKIICTQPYTKSLTYGLSFVRFHSPPENDEVHSKTASPKLTKLGQFKVKEDDNDSLKPGALFFSRASKPLVSPPKASQNNQPSPSYAAASLQTSVSSSPDPSPSAAEKPTTKASPKEPTPVKRKFEFSKENSGLSSAANKPQPDTARPAQPASKKLKASPSALPSPKTPPSKKLPQTQPSEGTANVSFQRLLQGTVFVLSGFQNPFRSELRDKALEMGAKYRPDWTPDSTHLICAFANTPKYSQVKGLGGTIVRKEWILDCYRTKRCLPCKRYLMVSPESSSSEKEEESDEDTPARHHKPLAHPQRADVPSSNHKPKTLASPKAVPRAPKRASSEEEEEPTTSRSSGIHNNSQAPAADSGASSSDEDPRGARDNGDEGSGDTDDELRRVEEEHRKKQQGGRRVVPEPDDDPYGGSTDENTDVEEKEEPDQPIPELPDLFVGKHFFLYGEFPSQERRLLNRYIVAFNGQVEDYMNERVNYVITAQEWDDTFEEALNENANLSFVRPRWIYNCNQRQKLIPHQPYVVVPRV